jgi:hypothetical protein
MGLHALTPSIFFLLFYCINMKNDFNILDNLADNLIINSTEVATFSIHFHAGLMSVAIRDYESIYDEIKYQDREAISLYYKYLSLREAYYIRFSPFCFLLLCERL